MKNVILLSNFNIGFRYTANKGEVKMHDKVLRKIFLGFIQVHILHHAKKGSVYGSFLLEELKTHGYEMSPGTLYPILHHMQTGGLLEKEEKTVNGKIRKYYKTTQLGEKVLKDAREKAAELIREINE